MNEKAERINGLAARIGVVAAMGAYAITGQIIPGICDGFLAVAGIMILAFGAGQWSPYGDDMSAGGQVIIFFLTPLILFYYSLILMKMMMTTRWWNADTSICTITS